MSGKDRNSKLAGVFSVNRIFICPSCKGEVIINRKRKLVFCKSCAKSFSFDKVRYVCGLCNNMSDGISVTDDGEHESRCKNHFGSNTTQVKHINRSFTRFPKANTKSNKNIVLTEASRGKKTRVIRKGEFPGQHPN